MLRTIIKDWIMKITFYLFDALIMPIWIFTKNIRKSLAKHNTWIISFMLLIALFIFVNRNYTLVKILIIGIIALYFLKIKQKGRWKNYFRVWKKKKLVKNART